MAACQNQTKRPTWRIKPQKLTITWLKIKLLVTLNSICHPRKLSAQFRRKRQKTKREVAVLRVTKTGLAKVVKMTP